MAAAKSKKAAMSPGTVRGRLELSSAPNLKKPNPPKIQKAKSPQKSAVKSAAMPMESQCKSKHGAQVLTKKPKASQTKAPAKPKSPKKAKTTGKSRA